MIDREKRDEAADVIRRFRDGLITNRRYDDEWPDSKTDRAFEEIFCQLWFFYCDLKTHTLTAKDGHELSPQVRGIFDRCIRFLRSDREYDWSKCSFGDPSFLLDVPTPQSVVFRWHSCLINLAMIVLALVLLFWLPLAVLASLWAKLLVALSGVLLWVLIMLRFAAGSLRLLLKSFIEYFRPQPPPPTSQPREPRFQPGREYWPFKTREELEKTRAGGGNS